jgi:phosphohistidine phosphatase
VKHLLIIRHAKSSWAGIGEADFDRPLNERGKNDAPMMAKRLLDRQVPIDIFISSTANRALSTAAYFAGIYQVEKNAIQQVRKLYHAHPSVFYEVISNIDYTVSSAALFSHNPGITEFVNGLTATHIDNIPTCGIFAVTADIAEWKDFAKAKKTFWFFDYPKL